MIRYRTGDLSVLSRDPCRCGRTLARMARVKGRTDDMIVVRGVNVYPSQVEALLVGLPGLAPHYQLVVDRGAAMARLEVQVEVAEAMLQEWGPWRADRPELLALRETVAHRLRAGLAITSEVTIVAPRTIPRSEGKAIRVVERTEARRTP